MKTSPYYLCLFNSVTCYPVKGFLLYIFDEGLDDTYRFEEPLGADSAGETPAHTPHAAAPELETLPLT